MLNDYKGETPKNVITAEEHKKRPFYKKVSFWVLSALGLFFGGCSVYGLVLGYQYVHAVTEAAHIIADANESDEKTSALSKKVFNRVAQDNVFYLKLADLEWYLSNGLWFTDSTNGKILAPDGQNAPSVVIPGYQPYSNSRFYSEDSPDFGFYVNSNGGLRLKDTSFATVEDFVAGLGDKNVYFLGASGYDGVNPYDGGYAEGHQDGYQEGFDDGSDAINLPQSVKVLLPVGNEYSAQYKSYVDGVVDRQGQLSSSQSGGAYATFDRSRNQKLRIDLTVPSGSRAFFLYSPSWTSSYPTDENYSLRQSWAVSGVTYLPTWVGKPQVYVNVTSADVPDLTYETISVSFDVDHWGDIKIGAYSQGYNDGYQAGEENPTAYDSGYDAGYSQGYDDGHTLGVAQGESQAVSGQKALVNMFVTAFQQPFDQIYRFLNFNVLGLNILALFTALLTLSIGIIIIKKVI